jgi:hypothetical protein
LLFLPPKCKALLLSRHLAVIAFPTLKRPVDGITFHKMAMHTRAGGYPLHQQQAYAYPQTARAPVQVQAGSTSATLPSAPAQLPRAGAASTHPVEAGIAKRKKIKSTARMSYATKLEILQRLKEEPGFTQAVAARTYKVTDAAISHLKKTFVNDEHVAQLRAMAVANPKGKAIGKGAL